MVEKLLSHYIATELSVMTRAEKRVARIVLSDYPCAGLLSVARLAALSDVSGPTVLRFIKRLGFTSYMDFQERLLGEISQRKNHAYDLHKDRAGEVRDEGLVQGFARMCQDKLLDSLARLPVSEVEHAIGLLSNRKSKVTGTGGRSTDFLAQYLALRLHELRPGIGFGRPVRTWSSEYVLDINSRNVVVVIDIRPYQADTADFTRQANRNGAEIILITDPRLSPIAAVADCVLPVEVEGPTLFTSVVSIAALTELLVAGVADALGETAQRRRKRLHELRLASEH